jgi:hypothetical protein
MIFLSFGCVCKKVNMFLYFWNNLVLKIKVHIKVSERCFLWCKLDRGSIVVALSAMRMGETLT